jgi:hypothetical protein
MAGEEKCSEKNPFTTNQFRLFRCWSRTVTVESRQITAWVTTRPKAMVLYIYLRSSTSGLLPVFPITWSACYFFGKKAKTFSNLRPIIGYHDRCSSSAIFVSPSIYQIHTSSRTMAASFHITSASWYTNHPIIRLCAVWAADVNERLKFLKLGCHVR